MPAGLLITREYVSSLVKRPDFYDRFPEFRTLKNVPQQKGGCSGCHKSKQMANTFNLFRQILAAADTAAQQRFKNYVGYEYVQFIGYNPKTRRTETITL